VGRPLPEDCRVSPVGDVTLMDAAAAEWPELKGCLGHIGEVGEHYVAIDPDGRGHYAPTRTSAIAALLDAACDDVGLDQIGEVAS
jgi:hypothetical protein